MDWRDLEPDQRLTYLVGDIARSDVFLEGESGDVFRVVAHASTNPPERMPGDLSHLLDAIKDTLRGIELDDYAREMTRQSVIAAKAAHRKRMGPIHDRWMHQGGKDEQWTSVAMLTSRASEVPATPRNLDSFLKCRDDLLLAAWRMRGVGVILPMWLRIPTFMDHVEDDAQRFWTAVALGRFRIPSGAGQLVTDPHGAIRLPPKY